MATDHIRYDVLARDALRGVLRRVLADAAEQNPATAHMFIVNPLTGGHGWDNLFATHPNVENRIAALQQLAAELGTGGGVATTVPRTRTQGYGKWGQSAARRGPWG